jgi:hypothetical protein
MGATPINAELVEQLSGGTFLDSQRNAALIGGIGTGASHIAIGMARNIIRTGRKCASSMPWTRSTAWRINSRAFSFSGPVSCSSF